MDNFDFDIAILGAGPVGLALAIGLSKLAEKQSANSTQALRIALFQGKQVPIPPEKDTRVLALNHGSRVFLESLEAWPNKSTDIKTVHVSQKGRLGRTLITDSEMAVPRLGSMVSYAYLHQSLSTRLANTSVTMLSGELASAQAPAQDDAGQNMAGTLVTQGDQQYRVRLVIQCDGLRAQDIQRQYDQHALITSVYVRYPQPGWAWERFTQEGPLAVLPHPIFPGAQSIVWATNPAKAKQLLDMPEAEFEQALLEHFGDRLGRFTLAEKRAIFPLHLNVNTHTVKPNMVVIGNAAQTLHPVAGQGLNLGLRDVATLLNCLAPWFNHVQQDVQAFLMRYQEARSIDRRITWELTDFLPRVFTTKNPLVEHACGLSLLAMDMAKHLRQPLTTQLLQGFRP